MGGMDDGARTLLAEAQVLCILATSPSPYAHNEHSSFSCLTDWSACQSTQESNSQGQEQRLIKEWSW
jgi:hypothetical protein